MDYDTQSKKLAGPMALLKLYITRSATEIADGTPPPAFLPS